MVGHRRTLTVALLVITLVVLLASVPGSLREAWDRGHFYVFSAEFYRDLPERLYGPGRFRFVLQPLIAAGLGIRSGMADARAGRPPYVWGVLFDRRWRADLWRSGFQSIVNLLLMGVLLDSIAQWLILGASYPGAALLVGPVLVATPYAIARATANRVARGRIGRPAPTQAGP